MELRKLVRILLTLIVIITIKDIRVTGQSRRSVPPRIITQSQIFVVQSSTEYPNATLPCHVEGFPGPSIEWTLNKQTLQDDMYESLSEGSLLFNSVLPTLSGYYECRARNRFGESRVMHNLIVYQNLDQDSTTFWTNHHIYYKFIKISILATTDTSITITRKNLTDNTPLDIFYKPHNDTKDEGEKKIKLSPSMSEYTLEDLKCGQLYKVYTVYESRHILYVRTKGRYGIAPSKEKFIMVGENSAELNFNAWEDTSCPNIRFSVKYKPAFLGSIEGWITSARNISPTGNYNISGLSSNTSYILQIEVQDGATHNFRFDTQQLFARAPSSRPFAMTLLGEKEIYFEKTLQLDFYKVVCWVPENSSNVIWINPKNITVESGRVSIKNLPMEFGFAIELKIDKITEQDNGIYSCLSSIGEKESFNLHVKDSSKTFDTSLSEQVAYEGTEYCLKCSDHYGYSDISWKVNKQMEIPPPPKYTKRQKDGNLCIRNVTKKDATRKYFCSIKMVKSKSKEIKLTVLSQPWLGDTLLTKVWAAIGSYVNLTCASVRANPPPEFQWRRDNLTTIPGKPAYTILSPDENTSILQVFLSNNSMRGSYFCQAKNKVGLAEMKFSLDRAFRPPTPFIIVSVGAYNGARIKVDERLPSNSAPISTYIVQTRIVNNSNWDVEVTPWTIVASSNVSKRFDGFDFNNLMSDTTYQVKVACKNVAKQTSEYSALATVSTDVIREWSLPLEFKAENLFAFNSATDSKIVGDMGKWVEIHCVVFADPPARFEWKKNNRTIIDTHAIKIINTKPNTSILKIFLKHLKFYGDYICHVERFGEIREWTINVEKVILMKNTIDKIELLTLIPEARDVFVHADDSYLVSCQSPDGSNNLRWFDKQNRQIGTSTRSRIHVVPSTNLGMDLVFDRIRKEDAGTFYCKNVQNQIVLNLNVYQKPEFTEQPTTYWYHRNDLVNLTCSFASTPTGKISWECKNFNENDTRVFNVEENVSIIQVNITDEINHESTSCFCIVNHVLGRFTKVIKLERGLQTPKLVFENYITTNEESKRSKRITYFVRTNYNMPHLKIIGFDVQYRDFHDGLKNDTLTGWKVIGYDDYNKGPERGLMTGPLKPGFYQFRVATRAQTVQSAFSEPIFAHIYNNR